MTLDASSLPAAPVPLRGPVSLARRRLRRLLGGTLAGLCDAFFPTALGQSLHRRLLAQLDVEVVEPDLPRLSSGTRLPSIAFLSDLHLGHYLTAADLERMAERLGALAPDLVCLGGDLINHHAEELELLWPALRHLSAPLGVYAVPGNHDYVHPGELDGWSARLEAHGVRVLRNRGLRLEHGGGTLWLCGVDDLTEGTPDLAQALTGRRPGEPTLLLSHHPDLFHEASARGVDLQLSGHTHAGQIRFFGWAPLHHSRFGWVNGLYSAGAARLYVGRGGGVTALPIRIGTRSEVTLLRPRGAAGSGT
ncbi:MAG TPA: metallophosphoesterase [Planctomycetota bacterium]